MHNTCSNGLTQSCLGSRCWMCAPAAVCCRHEAVTGAPEVDPDGGIGLMIDAGVEVAVQALPAWPYTMVPMLLTADVPSWHDPDMFEFRLPRCAASDCPAVAILDYGTSCVAANLTAHEACDQQRRRPCGIVCCAHLTAHLTPHLACLCSQSHEQTWIQAHIHPCMHQRVCIVLHHAPTGTTTRSGSGWSATACCTPSSTSTARPGCRPTRLRACSRTHPPAASLRACTMVRACACVCVLCIHTYCIR